MKSEVLIVVSHDSHHALREYLETSLLAHLAAEYAEVSVLLESPEQVEHDIDTGASHEVLRAFFSRRLRSSDHAPYIVTLQGHEHIFADHEVQTVQSQQSASSEVCHRIIALESDIDLL